MKKLMGRMPSIALAMTALLVSNHSTALPTITDFEKKDELIKETDYSKPEKIIFFNRYPNLEENEDKQTLISEKDPKSSKEVTALVDADDAKTAVELLFEEFPLIKEFLKQKSRHESLNHSHLPFNDPSKEGYLVNDNEEQHQLSLATTLNVLGSIESQALLSPKGIAEKNAKERKAQVVEEGSSLYVLNKIVSYLSSPTGLFFSSFLIFCTVLLTGRRD